MLDQVGESVSYLLILHHGISHLAPNALALNAMLGYKIYLIFCQKQKLCKADSVPVWRP